MDCKLKSTLKDKTEILTHNTLTGQREKIKCKNMILDRYLDTLAGGNMFVLSTTATIFGSSGASENGSSTGLNGTEIDKVTSTVSQINIDDLNGGYGYIIRHKAIFPANNKTGTVRELVLNGVSRVVLDTPIEKDEYTQIEITWDIQQTLAVYSGIILKGQSDGETDIEWQLAIPYHSRDGLASSEAKTRVTPEIYFNGLGGGRANIVVGTSNAPTDLNRTGYSAYGTEMLKKQITTEGTDYIIGSFERSFFVLIDAYEAIGDIGEVLLYSKNNSSLYSYFRLFFRITFTPPLDKSGPDPYRLRLKFTFSLSRDAIN